TLPTVTSLTRTREFCCRFCTSGICARMVYAPGPPPLVPGKLIEFRPRNPQPDNVVSVTAASSAVIARRQSGDRLIVHLRTAPSFRVNRRPGSLAPPAQAAVRRLPVAVRQLPAAGCLPGPAQRPAVPSRPALAGSQGAAEHNPVATSPRYR